MLTSVPATPVGGFERTTTARCGSCGWSGVAGSCASSVGTRSGDLGNGRLRRDPAPARHDEVRRGTPEKKHRFSIVVSRSTSPPSTAASTAKAMGVFVIENTARRLHLAVRLDRTPSTRTTDCVFATGRACTRRRTLRRVATHADVAAHLLEWETPLYRTAIAQFDQAVPSRRRDPGRCRRAAALPRARAHRQLPGAARRRRVAPSSPATACSTPACWGRRRAASATTRRSRSASAPRSRCG